MKIFRRIKDLRRELSRAQGRVGFVPTMGFFHEGHLSLIRRAKKENDLCVVSLFVNPVQFGPGEDFARYPRDLKRDALMADSAGADILFAPSDQEMYPQGLSTYVEVLGVGEGLCGSLRPGHFRGVATVVAKLLNIVSPDVMYLGQKDAQQVVVLRRMVESLDIPVRIIACPTVREPDGLAMSSRNSYLSPTERSKASALYRALREARTAALRGESDADKIISRIKKLILEETGASIDYVSVVSASDLQPVRRIKGQALIAVAVRFPSARLIDNIILRVPNR